MTYTKPYIMLFMRLVISLLYLYKLQHPGMHPYIFICAQIKNASGIARKNVGKAQAAKGQGLGACPPPPQRKC